MTFEFPVQNADIIDGHSVRLIPALFDVTLPRGPADPLPPHVFADHVAPA